MGGHMEKEPQDKRESNTDYHPEVHARDVNNREVFKNNRLASQFLRNYTGISLFSDIEAEDLVNSIYGNAPKEIKDIFVKIIWSLLMKLNVPNEEAEEIVEQMRGGQAMGFLFENMDKMDIQAERRNTQREKERADKAEAEKQQTVEKNLALEKENQQLRAEIEKLKLEQSNRK